MERNSNPNPSTNPNMSQDDEWGYGDVYSERKREKKGYGYS